jgi:hypothetical protein
MKHHKTWLLALPIALVDIATFANVFSAYHYFEEAIPAILVAVAFAALQIGSLTLFAQPLAENTRRWLFVGTAVTLGVTGISNIGMAFLRAEPVLPTQTLLPVLGFGGTAQEVLVRGSWVFGLALVIGGLTFWSAYGQYLRLQREKREQGRALLLEAERLVKETDG